MSLPATIDDQRADYGAALPEVTTTDTPRFPTPFDWLLLGLALTTILLFAHPWMS